MGSILGGSQPAGQTTTTTIPWATQAPYLAGQYAIASNDYNTGGPQYYQGDTYAQQTPQQQGFENTIQQVGGAGGDSGLNAANGNVTSTLSPGYTNGTSGAFGTGESTLGSIAGGNFNSSASPNYGQSQGALSNELSSSYLNPWNSPSFGTAVNNTLASVMPGINSTFDSGNRSDSGLAAAAASQGATNAVGNLMQGQYNTNQQIQQNAIGQAGTNNNNATQNALAAAGVGTNNYLTQQGNQIKADALAPGVDSQQMSDLQGGFNAATQGQTNAQNQLNANVQDWNYNQMLPFNNLSMYQQAIAGSPGGSVSSPYFENQGANLVSGATGLLGLNNLTSSAGGGFGSTALGQAGSGLGSLLAFL